MFQFQDLPQIGIKCTSADCENGLHCFKPHRQMAAEDRGKCRACGANAIDWPRVHRRDLNDANYTFEALQYELIRQHHFHKPLDEDALRHARRKGMVKLSEMARIRLARYLAPESPPRDGYQTPFTGNSIYYAQHATATCCRTCLEYWHGIPRGRVLSIEELDYCAALINRYLQQKLRHLRDEPEPIERRRIKMMATRSLGR